MTINNHPYLSELINSEWKQVLLDKKIFPVSNVLDLVYSFSVKKDSKNGKMTFTELIQKNVRKKDKNVKSISTILTDFEDITEKHSDIDNIHEADL